jgi:hypothetical protein
MYRDNEKERIYPACCTSAFCGSISTDEDCKSCCNRQLLDDFKDWKERTKAVQLDHIWCPRYWTATV